MEHHGWKGLKEEKGGQRIMREGQDGLREPEVYIERRHLRE